MNYYVGNWLTLVIFSLITEKLRVFILPGPSSYRARVRCTFSTPLS